MISGWQTDPGGKRCFYHEGTGEMMCNCWIEWKNNFYYLHSDGSMAKSEWIDDRWIDKNGIWDPDIHHNSERLTTISRRDYN